MFAQNYIWKGSYNYKGKKQPMTLTVTHFNASSGRVNATLTNSNMELLLSGRNNNYKCLYLILLTCLPTAWYPFHGSDDHCKALHSFDVGYFQDKLIQIESHRSMWFRMEWLCLTPTLKVISTLNTPHIQMSLLKRFHKMVNTGLFRKVLGSVWW